MPKIIKIDSHVSRVIVRQSSDIFVRHSVFRGLLCLRGCKILNWKFDRCIFKSGIQWTDM